MTRPAERLGEAAGFLLEFARSPAVVGAVAPTSRALATVVTGPVPDRGDPVVVELGAGTGSITEVIAARLGGRGRHLAVELNPRLAALTARRFPQVDVLCADANELPAILADRGLVADVVVSALPWAAFASGMLHRRVAASMAGDAVFTQLAYVWTQWAPPARRELADLRAAFEEVTTSSTVWGNLPPALAYLARRPRRPAAG